MKPSRPVTCEQHPCAATLQTRTARVRRGDRSTTTPSLYWSCASCVDPVEGGPLEFVDAELMARNDEAAVRAWEESFGEPLPPARRPGRKPVEPHTERVVLLLTETELTRLDKARGELSRSEYIRALLGRAAS